MNIKQALEKIATAEVLLREARTILQEAQTVYEAEVSSPIAQEEHTEFRANPPKEHDINTIKGIVAQLLELAIQNLSDEEVRPILDRITHTTIDSKALTSIMRFNWIRLKDQIQDYLNTPSDPYSFTITREQDRSTGNIAEKKLFLAAKSRNPVPLTLRKDTGETEWRIYTFSL
jgi:uncharacterized protein YPO0396